MPAVEMMQTSEMKERYLRTEGLNSLWCPGCGIGTISGAIVRAVENLELPHDDVVIVTGIGCSGLIYNYLNFDGFHGTHGRAIPAATGMKIANPRLKVIVPMGDGDCAAIGGNHFIQAARRNIDLTAIVINNQTYGMTGGQYSPLSPQGSKHTTASLGHIENPFDICKLAIGAGATYVARSTAFHAQQMVDLISKAITHPGFSVVEIMSQCHVHYGKRNYSEVASEMLFWYKDHALNINRAAKMSEEEIGDRFITGELYNRPTPEWTAEYDKVIAKAQARSAEEQARLLAIIREKEFDKQTQPEHQGDEG